MSLQFHCACGRALTAPESAVGRRGRCPGCGTVFAVPAPAVAPIPVLALDEADDPYAVVDDGVTAAGRSPQSIHAARRRVGSVFLPPRAEPPPEPPPVPLQAGSTARPYRYLLLLLALLPLAWSTVRPTPDRSLGDRIKQTVIDHPEVQARLDDLPEHAGKRQVLELLPGDRVEGALLPYDTLAHWGLAALSGAGFFGLVVLLFPPGHTKLWQLGLVGAFTGTAGILLLLAFQFFAFHMGLVRGGGTIALLLDLIWLIGQSYRMALGDHGVLLSALGFTAGVGFCEETCKAIPLLFKARTSGFGSWRSAMLWGLVSGVGFGVSEGITYSHDYYNGVLGGQVYAVRFVSCVALHGIWAAAVGIAVYRRQDRVRRVTAGADWLVQVLAVVIVPMVLHGLYDTLLKQQYEAAALGVALASFAWLAVQVELAKRRLDGPVGLARDGRLGPA